MRILHNTKGAVNLVPIALAIIIAFAVMLIGSYINGTIHSELEDGLTGYADNGFGGPAGLTNARMNNTSANWDSALDIVQVVIIITILAAAIGAIFLFTRYGR